MAYGHRCAICMHIDHGGIHPDPIGSVDIEIIRSDEVFHVCEYCVKEIINAERRRKYAENNWARNQLKHLKKLKNRPSKIGPITLEEITKFENDKHFIDITTGEKS